ncbi:MAG: pyridoxal phosphate-dependent aminotransferase [Verrucomicrobia bacterium]|nr:pyridoxal phosphate-dependent aminotransferase [Verrucomicrobiota bacterium]
MTESSRLRAVQAPIIPVIADLVRAHPGTISLGQGVVGYGPPPEAFAELARFSADPALHKYQPVAGIAPLLDALAQKLATENRIRTGPTHGNRVLVTAGGNLAFANAILAICDPGDEVILPTPYYFNHEMMITMANCRPVLVPTDASYQLDLNAVRRAITPRTRAIVTVSPNNPTGAVYPAAALRAVNELCAEHGVFHISDEAYESFVYDGAEHFSAASLAGSAPHTISLFSLSKACGFASWRIGWMVFPDQLESAIRKIQDTLLICPPVISQFAAIGALRAGTPWVRARLADLAVTRTLVQRELATLAADGVVEIPPAQGAFYFLLRVHTPRPPLELAERLIREHGVAVIPGNAFGLTPRDGSHLRVAYGALAPDTATEALGRLARGLRALV